MAAGGTPTKSPKGISKKARGTKSPSKSPSKSPTKLMKQLKISSKKRPDPESNVVSWTLSGDYDRKRKVLIEADESTSINKERFVSLEKAIDLVASLTGAFNADSTVCLNLPNHVLYPVLCLAIWSSRCRYTGTNPMYKAGELEHHFRLSATRYVITDISTLDAVATAVEKSKTKAEIIIFGDILDKSQDKCCGTVRKGKHYHCLHDLLRDQTEEDLWSAVEKIDPDSVALLGSTSGTTGKPKMAVRTHRAIVHESKGMDDPPSGKPYEVKRLFCTPIFHAFSLPDMVINGLRHGTPSYFVERFDKKTFPSMIRKFHITEIFGPPSLLQILTQEPCSRKIQSLRMVYTGGAPFTHELRGRFNELFASGGSPPVIAPVWGMTECGWITTFKWSEQEVSNSVGRVQPGYEIKTGVAFDALEGGQQTHELLVRGHSVMTEYRGNETATKETLEDGGWLRTGDVGYVTDDGRVFLVDRAKDLIKFNGWQVSPTELGDVLLISSDVKDAAVVGAGTGTEEHPVAFVVRAETAPDVSAKDIQNHMLEHLAKYKVGRLQVLFVDEIPKNPTGKIDRKELKRLADLAQPAPSGMARRLRSSISKEE